MVALWTACILLPVAQSPAPIEAYPDLVLEALSKSGVDVEGTRSAWAGRLSSNGSTLDYSLETRAGRATAIDLYSRYSFPTRVSVRALQDWVVQSRSNVAAQAYLDGSVYVSERLPIGASESDEVMTSRVKDAFAPFKLFQSSFVTPGGGQQVFGEPTVFPPKPSDRMVVDYVNAPDLRYLAKLWGWSYTGPYGAPIRPTWTVPIFVHKRLWTITGPTGPGTSLASGFEISGQFEALSKPAQRKVRSWSRHFKMDRVEISPSSADVQVSTTIDLKGGVSLGALRKKIVDFVRRAEMLPAPDNSVFD